MGKGGGKVYQKITTFGNPNLLFRRCLMRKIILILTVFFFIASLISASETWAQKEKGKPKLLRLTFYYPVGVAGPLARVIGEMTDKINKEKERKGEGGPGFLGGLDS